MGLNRRQFFARLAGAAALAAATAYLPALPKPTRYKGLSIADVIEAETAAAGGETCYITLPPREHYVLDRPVVVPSDTFIDCNGAIIEGEPGVRYAFYYPAGTRNSQVAGANITLHGQKEYYHNQSGVSAFDVEDEKSLRAWGAYHHNEFHQHIEEMNT